MASPKPYSAIHVALIWWQENDFGRTLLTNEQSKKIFESGDKAAKQALLNESEQKGVKLELNDFGEFAEKSLGASVTRIEIPSKDGNEPEDFLLSELQKFYTGIGTPKEQALVILVYSGHGAPGPCGPNTLQRTGYKPRGAQGLLWSDILKPNALLDWSWVQAQLKPSDKLNHWFICNCCFAGLLLGLQPTRQEYGGLEIPLKGKGTELHTFMAVGPQLTAKTGEFSFLKMVLQALQQEHQETLGRDGSEDYKPREQFTIHEVWNTLAKLPDYEKMLRMQQEFTKLKVDNLSQKEEKELWDWVLKPMTDDEEKALKKQIQEWKKPYYRALPTGVVEKYVLGASKGALTTKASSAAAGKGNNYSPDALLPMMHASLGIVGGVLLQGGK